MTRVLPVCLALLLLAGSVYPYPDYYQAAPGTYPVPAAPPPPPPATAYITAPFYEPGYGYVIIDPIPQLCCGWGWYVGHYRGHDGRWHRSCHRR
jgi:hypothetical protein